MRVLYKESIGVGGNLDPFSPSKDPEHGKGDDGDDADMDPKGGTFLGVERSCWIHAENVGINRGRKQDDGKNREDTHLFVQLMGQERGVGFLE